MRACSVLFFLNFMAAVCAVAQDSEPVREPIVVTEAARRIHRAAPVVDGHNDLPWALRKTGGSFEKYDIAKSQPEFHTDIERLKQGGIGAQFWSVYVPVSTSQEGSALTQTLEQIEIVKAMATRYSDDFELAYSTADIARIRAAGKIGSMIGVEGGHSIENSLGVLRQLYQQGARYMTLTHSMSLPWADSCSDEPISGGLSPFGVAVVQEMNRLGMLIDLSHVSADCMRQTLQVTTAPVIFSHSSARAIADHPRNVPDDVLKLTRKNGGVVMINFFNDYVNPANAQRSVVKSKLRTQWRLEFADDSNAATAKLKRWEIANPRPDVCTAHDVLDHIDHVVEVAGIDHVGLGSDFDGVSALPQQLEDVSCYPVITQGLLDRGYQETDIQKVLGENVIRVFHAAEVAAAKLQD
ncbi:MAG: dipeptidase [Rubripirellula sp.]